MLTIRNRLLYQTRNIIQLHSNLLSNNEKIIWNKCSLINPIYDKIKNKINQQKMSKCSLLNLKNNIQNQFKYNNNHNNYNNIFYYYKNINSKLNFFSSITENNENNDNDNIDNKNNIDINSVINRSFYFHFDHDILNEVENKYVEEFIQRDWKLNNNIDEEIEEIIEEIEEDDHEEPKVSFNVARLKELWARYGKVAIATYFTIYGFAFTGMYWAADAGIFTSFGGYDNPAHLLSTILTPMEKIPGAEPIIESLKHNPHFGTIALAWLGVKISEPIRFAITFWITPKIARKLGLAPPKRKKFIRKFIKRKMDERKKNHENMK